MARRPFDPPEPEPWSPAEAAGPIEPYGGRLICRELRGEARDGLLRRARRLRRIPVARHVASDLELLANGALSPLGGFMTREDYRSVVEGMRLSSGLPWTLPVVLALPEGEPDLSPGEHVSLVEPGRRRILAVLRADDVFRRDLRREAELVYGTADPRHPGVLRLLGEGRRLVGGPVWVLRRPAPVVPGCQPDPVETRRMFRERGWRRVVAFQTRNPVHRAHEYIQKCALEVTDGLLLHPLVGETKPDDLPARVRFAAYRAALAHYYPSGRVVLAAFPGAMRYAGPREAVHHAIVRRNYGATHIVIGRDHAGVAGYYGPYDAQAIFARIDRTALGIEPFFFEDAFFCRACAGMATARTCPHGPEWHVTLSGTLVRQMLRRGEAPPPEVTRPEVARVLIAALARPQATGRRLEPRRGPGRRASSR
ncbi:MAG: sulfate adenylyltransferase [Clostridia bacterium]|nr:sulfate adenylyltransferase [Clostridia bacterium]